MCLSSTQSVPTVLKAGWQFEYGLDNDVPNMSVYTALFYQSFVSLRLGCDSRESHCKMLCKHLGADRERSKCPGQIERAAS